MGQTACRFAVGQLVLHKLFDYRGVIIDVDAVFQGTDEWYEFMAKSRPPKDKPWYHVLVHGAQHRTYVSERNLRADNSAQPVQHPDLEEYFEGISGSTYVPRRRAN